MNISKRKKEKENQGSNNAVCSTITYQFVVYEEEEIRMKMVSPRFFLGYRPVRIFWSCSMSHVNCNLQRAGSWCNHSLYHLLHNGAQNKPAEQNKGKAPLGKAVTGLWSYLTCLQRDWLWCSENSSQTVTHSHEIIAKRVPEHSDCPAGSTGMNFCLFFVQNVFWLSHNLSFGVMSFAAWHLTVLLI